MTPKPKSVKASASGRVKEVKAWAIEDKHGIFCPWVHGTRSGCIKLFVGKPYSDALDWASWRKRGCRVVRVIITKVKQ